MAWNRVDDGEQYEAARRLNAEAGRTWTVMWAPGLRAYVAFYQGTAAVRWQGSPTAEGLMERLREAERGLRAGPGGSRTPERGGGDGPRAGGAHRRRDAAPVPGADTVSGTTAAVSAPAGPVAAVPGLDEVWAPGAVAASEPVTAAVAPIPDMVTGSWAPPQAAGAADPVEGADPDGSVRTPVPDTVRAGFDLREPDGSATGAGRTRASRMPAEPDPGPESARAEADGVDAQGQVTPGGGEGAVAVDGPDAGRGSGAASPSAGRHAAAPAAPVAADVGTARSRALMRRPAPVPAPAAVPDGGTGAPGARSDDSGLRAATSSGDGSGAAGGFAATAPEAVAVDGGDLARAGEAGRTSRRGGDTRTGNASGAVRAPVRTRTGEDAGHGGADHVIETAPGTARATFVPAGGGTGAGPWSATTRLRGPRPGARAVVIPGEPVADGYWTCPAQGCSWTSINPMSHPCPVGGQTRARGRGHGRSPARARGEFGVEGALRAGPAS